MVNLFRRSANWVLRRGGQRLLNVGLLFAGRKTLDSVLRLGGQSAVDSALGAAMDAVPLTAQQTYTQVFNVTPPITVYVRASHCRINLRRAEPPKVILETNTARAFGLEFAAEQDDAGIYIVARRKSVVGQIARVDFTLTVPHRCHLAFNLTPGDVVLQEINGLFELPPESPDIPGNDPPPPD